MADQTIGCLTEKCLNSMTKEEAHQITLNIHSCLIHPKGNALFARYLKERFSNSFQCLNMYNICSKYLAEEQNQSIQRNSLKESRVLEESLITKVKTINETIEYLNVPELNSDLMMKFNEALEKRTKEALLTVLEITKGKCQDHLHSKYESFKNIL